MKIEVEVYDIPKDKDGFFDENSDLYEQLPILVFDNDKGSVELAYYGNWGDWLSDFNKSMYKHYIKLNEIIL